MTRFMWSYWKSKEFGDLILSKLFDSVEFGLCSFIIAWMSARSCFDLFLSGLECCGREEVRSVLYNNFSLIPFIWFVSTLETKSTFEFFQSFLLLDLGFASTILSFMAGGGGLSSSSPLTVSWPSRSPQLLARSGLAWPKGRREFVSSLLTILLTFLLGLYHLTMWATTLTSPLFSLRSRWLSHFRWERVCKRSLLVIISGPESRVIQTTILQPTKLIIPEHVTCKSSPSCLYWPIQFRHVTSSVILRVTVLHYHLFTLSVSCSERDILWKVFEWVSVLASTLS